MMRYLAVGVVIVLFLIFLAPPLMAWARNLMRQSKSAWEESEPTDMELQEIEHDELDDEDREDVGSRTQDRSADEPPKDH